MQSPKAALGLFGLLLSAFVIDQVHGDDEFFFVSKNYDHKAWGLGQEGPNDVFEALITPEAEMFKVVPGLNGTEGSVSFESTSKPGYFLRHFNYTLYLESKDSPRNPNIFEEDATFLVHDKKYGYTKHKTYESVNYPGYFIRHQDYKLKIAKDDNSELFGLDASFKLKKNFRVPPRFIVSYNFPDRSWGLTDDAIPGAFITDQNQEQFRLVPGLTGEEGTVSFESAEKPGYYLRHFSYVLYLEPKSNPRTPGLFNEDATFKEIRKYAGFNGYVSFQSINYPDRYIRHQGYVLKIHTDNGSDLFKKDASFKVQKKL